MEIRWYGTASLILREGDTSIAFDPFGGLPIHSITHPVSPLPYENDFLSAKHIFVTHGHLDHIYHIPRLYRHAPATVYCTRTPKKTLLGNGFPSEKIREIAPGWKGRCGPFAITAYQGRHCVFDLPLIRHTVISVRFWRHPVHLLRLLALHLRHRENGEILFYEITCRGQRIQVMGSMGLDSKTAYPTGADLLILPLQGRSDQDTYALKLVERLKPKAILLDHYDNTFPPLSDDVDTSGFIRNVRRKFKITCEPLRKEIPVSLSKDLPVSLSKAH